MTKQNKKKKHNKYDLLYARIIGLLLASAIFTAISHDYQSQNAYVLEEKTNREYDGSSLYVVRYRDHYYLTDSNLNDLARDRSFHIIDWDMEEELLGIYENDVVSFLSFANSMNFDQESYTLIEAQLIIENCHSKDYIFPDYILNRSFELAEDPLKIGKEYTLNSENQYDIDDLYIVYKNGNLFLCTEQNNYFYLIDAPCDSNIYFNLYSKELENSNYITTSQIVNFSKYLNDFQLKKKYYLSGKEAYQLLETGITIVGSPFLKKESEYYTSFPYPYAQIKKAKSCTSQGYQFLDCYHNNDLKLYNFNNIYVVEYYYGQYLLVEDIYYDEWEDEIYMKPIYSTTYQSMRIFYNGIVKKDFLNSMNEVELDLLPTLSDIIKNDPLLSERLSGFENGTATFSYQILELYLVTHCYQIDQNIQKNVCYNENCEKRLTHIYSEEV